MAVERIAGRSLRSIGTEPQDTEVRSCVLPDRRTPCAERIGRTSHLSSRPPCCSLAAAKTRPGGRRVPVTAEAACEHEFRVRIERCRKVSIAPATMASMRRRYVSASPSRVIAAGRQRLPRRRLRPGHGNTAVPRRRQGLPRRRAHDLPCPGRLHRRCMR